MQYIFLSWKHSNKEAPQYYKTKTGGKMIRRIMMGFFLHKFFAHFSEMKKCENTDNMTERSP